ncbi:MAG TPA: DUF3501 family protein [Acidimicrobiales bacterium]|nr:DUF3501 family protein [Acidimicrobiales bacterium]
MKLQLDDIADLRAYERERDAFRTHVIDLKRRRRVGVGPLVSVVFENRDTVRFQVQEMARAERMLTDAAIQGELDAYNPLIPGPGELSATMFLELTTPAELREWLPKLVGVERAVALRVGAGVVPAEVEAGHAGQLTRDDVTASVHYVRWSLGPDEIARWRTGPVALLIDHPSYRHETPLSPATREELLRDLVQGG